MDWLAARRADIWNAAWPNRAEALVPRLAAIDAACQEVGRDPATLERTVGVMADLPGVGLSRDWLWAKIVREPLNSLTGSAGEIAAELQSCADLGVAHAQVWLDPPTVAGIEAFAPVLELLDRD